MQRLATFAFMAGKRGNRTKDFNFGQRKLFYIAPGGNKASIMSSQKRRKTCEK